MSNCSNCYNGCTEIVSDRCVKYTGIDVPILGIQTGDSLSFVEQALITFLTSTLDGTGIYPIVDSEIICNVVKKYLPTCGDLSLNDILSALIEAACDLQEQVDAIVAELAILNANYTIECLTGVTASSDTHAIVQAVITTLCQLKSDFEDLLVDLPNTYVAINDLNDLIQAYLNSTTGNLISNKMVPYAVLPYFGPITFFNSLGAGTGDWARIFLCNGNNGTPDLRGRALTGAINGVPGPTITDPVIIPGGGNPNYSLYDNAGANQISLLETQIPLHTHNNTLDTIVNFNDPGHFHNIQGGASGDLHPKVDNGLGVVGDTTTNVTNITIDVITNLTNAAGPVGGGLPHSNIQPVTACYYIQYRP